jgi:hypothetical protein
VLNALLTNFPGKESGFFFGLGFKNDLALVWFEIFKLQATG